MLQNPKTEFSALEFKVEMVQGFKFRAYGLGPRVSHSSLVLSG